MPRTVHEWTLDKLKILELYLPGYLGATQSAIETIYIDGFAGPGMNQIHGTERLVQGSPLIALSARSQAGDRFDRLYFIEKHKETFDELETLVASRDTEHRATVIHGDVNVELPRVVRQINKRTPTFVLLDTDAIEPAWRTIEAIAAWRTELLINFPLGMSINRNPDSAKAARYFDSSTWRDIWEGGRVSRTSGLLKFYLSRLAELGYDQQPEHPRLIRSDANNNPLYYLLLASKHPAAKSIMDWVLKQPDASGQSRLDLDSEPQ